MTELVNSEYIEQNPLFKHMSSYTIFTSIEDFKNIKAGKTISIKGENIPIEYLKRILEDEKYYNYVLDYFSGETPRFIFATIVNGDIGNRLEYKKIQLFNAIKNIIKPYEEDKNIMSRFDNLKESLFLNKFIIKHYNDNFKINVENKEYEVPILGLIELINLKEDKFSEVCENDKIKTINEIPKDYFLYILKTFIEDNKLIEDYIIPSNIFNNYTMLKEGQLIDIDAINKFLKTTDTKYKYVKLNKDLEQKIISNMPEDLSDLEKAMYIYIKMCKTLSYDEEYYAVNQKGDAVEKHQDLKYVSEITLDNPKAVCFEFNVIYTKFLHDLGINFQSNYKNMIGEVYGDGHVELDFRVGKYLVHADSVTTILGGDIVRSKLNQPIIGLTCENLNLKTKEEFNNSLNKVYTLINEEDKNNKKPADTIENLLEEYKNLTENVQKLKIKDKFNILMEKIASTELKGIDAYYYILKMKKIFFTPDEEVDNLSFNLIRNNLPIDEDKTASVIGIFTVNDYSFNEYEMLNDYYLVNEEMNVSKISKDEIAEKFDSGEYDYIKKTDSGIPGVLTYRRKK